MLRSAALLFSAALVLLVLAANPAPRSAAAGVSADPATCQDDDFAFPPKLSAAGLYADMATRRPAPQMVPYEVNSGFWSDGATKQRFLVLPAGKRMVFHADSPWEIPDRTMFVLTLSIEQPELKRILETRIIQIHGNHLHFGTYVWNEAGTEADLTLDGTDFYLRAGGVTQLWEVAGVDDCVECHTPLNHQILGLRTEQINREMQDGDQRVNQLRRLADRGALEGLPESLVGLTSQCNPMDESKPLAERARSYIETNCSICHQPGGNGSGTLDLRAGVPMHQSGAIRLDKNLEPTRGVLVPGKPERSSFVNRMRIIGGMRMPNVLSIVPDEKGVKLISDWISSM